MFGMGGGINTGPSMGFMDRLKQNLPGAINAVGTQYGGAFSPMSQAAGQSRNRRLQAQRGGNNTPGNQTQSQNGPGGMPPNGPTPTGMPMSDIVRRPSFMPPGGMGVGMNAPQLGPMVAQSVNPGVEMTGPGMMNSFARPQIMGGGGSIPGMWGMYNNLSNETGGPAPRSLMY